MAEAGRSLGQPRVEHGLALKAAAAFGEPAGQDLSHLVFHTGVPPTTGTTWTRSTASSCRPSCCSAARPPPRPRRAHQAAGVARPPLTARPRHHTPPHSRLPHLSKSIKAGCTAPRQPARANVRELRYPRDFRERDPRFWRGVYIRSSAAHRRARPPSGVSVSPAAPSRWRPTWASCRRPCAPSCSESRRRRWRLRRRRASG